ncbi:MAG: hypothetical protein ACE5HY_06495 [Candidatus Hydrothermarchaeales archaeon]
MKSKIVFADITVKKAFEKLKDSTTEDKQLYDWLLRAFKDLGQNTFSGIQIPKRLIPKEYVQNTALITCGNTTSQMYGDLSTLWLQIK